MKQRCKACGRPFKDGDRIKAVVLSIFHEISSSVSYAMEQPYECISLEHQDCTDSADSEPEDHSTN